MVADEGGDGERRDEAARRGGDPVGAAGAAAAISLADNAPDVLSRFDRDCRYVYVNRAIERYTGRPREAFLGKTFREVGFPEENCALWNEAIRRTFETGEPSVLEFAVSLPAGLHHCEGFTVAERGRDGAIETVLTVTRDVTERVRALARLREGDERLRLAVDSAAIGAWDFDVATNELCWDDRCCALFGLPPDARVDYSLFLAHLHPDDRAEVDAAVKRALEPDGDGELDVMYRALLGEQGAPAAAAERWIRAKGRALFTGGTPGGGDGGDGGPRRAVRLIGTVIDVTDAKRAEAELRRAADIFRFTGTPVAVGSDRSSVLELCNPAFARLYGYDSPEELIGRPVASFYPPDERPRLPEIIRTAREAGHAVFETRHVRRDGTVFPVELDITTVRDDAGRPLYRIVNVTDLTGRRRAEAERAAAAQALAQSEARLRQALHAARMGMWDWEVATGKLTWAGHLEEIHGMEPGSFDGRFETYAAAIHPEDRPGVLAEISDALERDGGDFHTEFRVTYPDNSLHWVAGEGRVERDAASGKPVRMIGMGWDVTEVRRAQEEARRRADDERRRAEREALLNRLGETLRRAAAADAAGGPAQVRAAAERELAGALAADHCCFLDLTAAVGDRDDAPSPEAGDADAPTPRPSLRELLRDPARARELFCGPGGVLRADDLTAEARTSGEGAAAAAWRRLAALGLRAVAGVVLSDGRDAPACALVAGMARSPRAWTADDLELVRAVATLARAAIEDARLRRREHQIAERLQAALQPTLPGAVPGLKVDAYYQPALSEATIGGDFYDVFALEAGRPRAALVVADLSGKGLAAAAQVATVRHMLRTLLYLRGGTTLAEAVTALDRMIGEHRLLAGFATLFVGAYDAAGRTLTYVNAGQEPALLRRAATGAMEELRPTGPVLAGFPGAPPYAERAVTLAPGDVLAVFTDGLTEAGPSRKRLLGVRGVSSLFEASCRAADADAAPSRIVARLVRGVEAHAAPVGIRDDACLLVARVE